MKANFYFIAVLMFISCNNAHILQEQKEAEVDTLERTSDQEKLVIQYSDEVLEAFLDSIGGLDAQPLMDKVTFVADSIFRNQQKLNKVLSVDDFDELKEGINAKSIDYKTAKRIFGDFEADSFYIEKDTIPFAWYSFDKKASDYDEFAIVFGRHFGWECDVFFFKANRLIAKHHIFHRYGLELEHYKDTDGKTVIYYKENFGSGTGIWWFNFYFYKYYGNQLIPILNELENGNLQNAGSRSYWLETFVEKTSPLTLKMVYYQELPDTGMGQRFIDDSTLVTYTWDETSKTLVGDYQKSKITKAQILSYSLDETMNLEVLFINAHHKLLQSNLRGTERRRSTLRYLNEVKNLLRGRH